MKKDTSFVEYIIYDVLGHILGLTFKAMFSGYSIYLDGAIIAFIPDGELYFKADKKLAEEYKKKGYQPFTYDRNGKIVEMSYISVKAEDLENREEMDRRVEESYEVSMKE